MALTAGLRPLRHAFGATIAVRRDALEASGGFAPLADHLADDYLLGHRVAEAGYRVALLPSVVETFIDSTTLADVWRHQLRWVRTYRVCQPLGWALSIVTHATFWGVLAVAASGGAVSGWLLCAALLALRLTTLVVVLARLGERRALRGLWLVPAADLLASALWAAGFLGRSVEWGGRTVPRAPRRLDAAAGRTGAGAAGARRAVAARGSARELNVVPTHALAEEILDVWRAAIGNDLPGYRGHVYRTLNICQALAPSVPQDRIAVAGRLPRPRAVAGRRARLPAGVGRPRHRLARPRRPCLVVARGRACHRLPPQVDTLSRRTRAARGGVPACGPRRRVARALRRPRAARVPARCLRGVPRRGVPPAGRPARPRMGVHPSAPAAADSPLVSSR
jgi:hypothetical protein